MGVQSCRNVANDLTAIALERLEYGLSVLPQNTVFTALDENKPYSGVKSWTLFQKRTMTEEEARAGFLNAKGMAVICGAVSGNLLMMDFDKPGYFRDWLAIVPTELSARLLVETTLKHELDDDSGYHVYFRSESPVPRNQKLARDEGDKKAAIETRGEGGLSYCHPQPGYEVIQGDWLNLPVLSAEETELLLSAATALSMDAPEPERKPKANKKQTGTKAWERYDSTADFEQILLSSGAKCLKRCADRSLWTRPGKTSGLSATLFSSGILWNFSSNWQGLEPDRGYGPFRYRANVEFGGDFRAATKAIAKEIGPAPEPVLTLVTAEGEVVTYAQTDLGNAERLIHYAGGNLRYCAVWGKWLAWDGKRWAVDESGGATVQQYASALTKLMETEGDGTYGRKCQSAGKLRAMIDLAKGLPNVPVHPDDLDSRDGEINVQNGIYDFESGKLLPHDPTKLHTKIADGAFDENADAPRWEAFLNEVTLDDKELGDFLLMFLGYSLTGWTHEQKFLLCTGDGANGKGTLMETMRGIFGPYVADLPADMILNTHSERPMYEMESYKGVRLAYAQEPNKNRSLDRERIKKLVAGDLQRVAAKYGHPYDMKPKLKLWLLANGKPNVEFDQAFRRRTLVVPFEFRPDDSALDLRLVDKLLSERDGVLSCVLDAGHEYCKQGLWLPGKVAGAVDQYEEENDVLGAWMGDETLLEDDGYTHPAELFSSFEKYCERVRAKPGSLKTFKEAMRLKGYRTSECGHDKRWCYQGIVLKNSDGERPYWAKD